MNYSNQQPPPTVIYVTTTNAPPQTYPPSQYTQQIYPPLSNTQQIYPPQSCSVLQNPQQSHEPQPPPIMSKENQEWRNKPQSQALAAGGIIFMSAGMNLALGVGWSQFSYFGYLMKNFQFGWFVGVIIGTIFSMPLRHLISKRTSLAISSALIVIGGITYACQPYNDDALLAGRYLNGIAVGLIIVPFLIHASEVADVTYRGTCLATEQYSVSFGIAIQMIYAGYWNNDIDFPANRLHGIMDILFGLMAAASLTFFIESPITLLRKGEEREALEALSRLKRPVGVTTETISILDQHKTYVKEEGNLSIGSNLKYGILPLMKMLLFRSMMLAFCCSLPLNMAFRYSMTPANASWAPSVVVLCRIFGSIISLLLIDKIGRKLPSLLAIAILGGLSLGHAQLFQSLYDVHNIEKATNFYIAIQFFGGFFAPYASVYVGEAFPMKLKPFFLYVCVIVEQLVHIIFIMTIQEHLGDSLSVQGGLMLGAFVVLMLSLPETRNTSLSEAQKRFRQFLYVKCK